LFPEKAAYYGSVSPPHKIYGVYTGYMLTGTYAYTAQYALIRIIREKRIRIVRRMYRIGFPEILQTVFIYPHILGHFLQGAIQVLSALQAVSMMVDNQELHRHTPCLFYLRAVGPDTHPLRYWRITGSNQSFPLHLYQAYPAYPNRIQIRMMAQVGNINVVLSRRLQYGSPGRNLGLVIVNC
jgi:hypothetical protein